VKVRGRKGKGEAGKMLVKMKRVSRSVESARASRSSISISISSNTQTDSSGGVSGKRKKGNRKCDGNKRLKYVNEKLELRVTGERTET